jgi:hypothetical protein
MYILCVGCYERSVCLATDCSWAGSGSLCITASVCVAGRCTRYLRGKHRCAGGTVVEFQQGMRYSLNFLVKHGPDTNI